MKSVVAIGDLHCGHLFGLTPPEWQVDGEIGRVQADVWRFYLSALARRKPIHTLIVNGDAIDGKGDKSGGTELITTDRRMQCEIAAEAIRQAGAENIVIIYGTGYHTGNDEDWEAVLADMVDATLVGGHEMISVNETIFDCKHHLSSTRAPYHEFTAMAKEVIDAQRRNRAYGEPMPNVILRSHAHIYAELIKDDVQVIRLPAWQWHTKFGGRVCGGIVSIGLCWFECEEGGQYKWGTDKMDLRELIKPPLVL
jgi:hypothetical protein